jgi:hypothetical protein
MHNMQNMQNKKHTHTSRIHIPCFYMTLITNNTEYAKKMQNMHLPHFWYKKNCRLGVK